MRERTALHDPYLHARTATTLRLYCAVPSEFYYEALCQGVYYRTVWHNKIMSVLMPSKDTATLTKEALLLFIMPDSTTT